MWADFVVMCAPLIDSPSGFGEIREPVQVQALISEFPIEAFDEGILGRLAGLDEMQLDATALAPKEHLLAGELGAIVANDHPRQSTALSEFIETTCDLQAGDRHVHDLGHALARVVVHDVEDPDSPTGR